jgi:hypothetical protein
MNLFNLVAKLTLDDTEYKKGIDRATSSASSMTTAVVTGSKKSATAMATVGVAAADVSKRMNGLGMASIASGLKAAAGWAGVALSIAAVVTALKDAIYNTTEWAGGIKDLAQVYGMTYTQIQEVNYLAQESGKNAEWAIRKAQSSGQEYWEVLGLTNEEYKEMIAYANEMGIILTDDLVDGADRLGDQISQLKYQWQSLLAGLLAGDVNAEENLQKFFDRVMVFIEEFTPVIVQFSIKLIRQIVISLVKIAPQLVAEVMSAIIDMIFDVDWLQVGWDLAKAIAQGVINGLSELLFGGLGKIFGFEAPKVDFGGASGGYIDVGNNYEITERSTQELTIRVESDGVTANDKLVADSLEDKINKAIGNMLGGI